MSQPPSPPVTAGPGSGSSSGALTTSVPRVAFDVVDDLPGEFAERVVEAFHYRGGDRFSLALSGGPTAAWCYERLASHGETQIDWWTVDLFWVDERLVGEHSPTPQHERLVREVLLDRVGAANALYPLRSAGDVQEADAALAGRRLDLVHLDLQPDGALSSMPVGRRWGPGRIEQVADEAAARTYSFTPAAIAAADLVLVTAAGSARRAAVAAVRNGDDVPGTQLTARRIAWLVDRAAAG